MDVLRYILLSLACVSFVIMLWQWVAGLNFRMERTASTPQATLGVSILKPLKGLDSETACCLESWFQQEYNGAFQLLFGVASKDDPVCELVERLLRKYPEKEAKLVICSPLLGPNAKVSTLCHLIEQANHEHLIVADDDVFIKAGFVNTLMFSFENSNPGLVSCFYQIRPKNLSMLFEAIAVNADFWTQVLQGLMLKPMDFALGAVMALSKDLLRKVGGFESLLEYLADDYQLGNRVAKGGSRLEICKTPVECRTAPMTFRQVWSHQLRWGRTVRICQPVPYALSIISNGTLWPLLALSAQAPWGTSLFALAIFVRIATAGLNYRKLTGKPGPAIFAPLKDVLAFVIWFLSLTGNEITWRGERFRVNRGGKLTPLA